ncbi:probable chitinase 10 [Trichonephila clavata]|uniref:Probable chitinase 10 n=1 Tax=Trichonephila clavata TaxID=2740835 RepID=A0A8X6LUI3_TRICU|nr:probable chitinase 10 [Trichonephila clavata]
MVESSSDRQRFVRSAVSFLRKHGFDGLDLDWEYPGFRDGGQDDDKQGYAKLVKLDNSILIRAFDVPVLSKNLDFFNMLTYDYHTAHEPLTNHHAPLKEMPDLEDWDPNRLLNIEWSVKYYIKKGADPKKLVVGIPTYGRSYTLSDPDETDIGSPADGPGEQGEATREKGYLAYYEICQLIQEQDWELEAPYPDMMGPFAYKDNQWVGFDDEEIIIEKVKFIVKEGLGGGMVWTLDNDDFRGKCYGEQSPLINTLKTALEQGSALLTQTTTTTAAPKRTTERPSRRTKATSKPTKSTTPPVFTTPEPPQPFECEDEGFFNNPTDCKKYFWCLDSGPSNLGLVAHSFTCPSGLYFNKNRDSCDYAANVVCRVKKVTTTTTTAKPRPRPRTRKNYNKSNNILLLPYNNNSKTIKEKGC